MNKYVFHSRQDYIDNLLKVIKPMYELAISQNNLGSVHIRESGVVYSQKRADIEGFLRLLWGIAPLSRDIQFNQNNQELLTWIQKGILAGTDPKSMHYWGLLADYDQLFVEMGSLSTYLILSKEHFFEKLSKESQEKIFSWMDQINHKTIPNNNWRFFRVLVNTFFKVTGQRYNMKQYSEDLKDIESYYLSGGWYCDYPNQIDYYIPFGMHYYGLLVSILDPEFIYTSEYSQRAMEFSLDFKHWFSINGEAIPFGRSLTYRFAQSAFWSIAIAKGIFESKAELSEAKFLLQENLESWFNKPIFDTNNFLSIGYAYPNQIMAEGYNGPGSPYWALKTFAILLLDEDDIFWKLEPQKPIFEKTKLISQSRMLICHEYNVTDVQCFTVGQHSHEHAHASSKYEKFVYSTNFGFSLPKSNALLKQLGLDCTLALSESEEFYRAPYGYESYKVTEEYLFAVWKPWKDVSVEIVIIPHFPYHLRIYHVKSSRDLFFQDGAFSLPRDCYYQSLVNNGIQIENRVGISAISTNYRDSKLTVIETEPNTNVLFPRAVYPAVLGQFMKGETIYTSIVLGDSTRSLDLDGVNCYIQNGEVQLKVKEEERKIVVEELKDINLL